MSALITRYQPEVLGPGVDLKGCDYWQKLKDALVAGLLDVDRGLMQLLALAPPLLISSALRSMLCTPNCSSLIFLDVYTMGGMGRSV